ncbi:hypothetical protein B9Z55_000218 [Caenorhabditis nigoni]|uniref:Uncharacterized protein n=2 Tax=Caenorhabditis nigoni TaxID=1611254 RepID=A0A2G5VJ95_9PELO|nr:hypothetical protein B9Z55_000218 [Caenorhabditis nigoni]
MNHYLAAVLIIAVSIVSILPGFPVLILLQNYFPELPDLYTIDSLVIYLVQATIIMFLGFISMCIYSDIACPLAIKGYVAIFSRIYILLEDLESWYESRFVTPDDTVRIFNANGDSKEFKISSLIFFYGSEHPFRKAAKLLDSDYSSSDSDEERAGPSTVPSTVPPPKKVGGAFGARKVVTPPISEAKTEEVLEKMGGACEKDIDHDNKPEDKESSSTVDGSCENPRISFLEPPPQSNLNWKRGDPRVPLMNLPNYTDLLRMAGKETLVEFIDSLKSRLTEIGKETAKSKSVWWKCDYCSFGKRQIIHCRTQFEAFNHILKQKHQTNMKFTAPESDLKFWNDWIDKMNSGAPEDLNDWNDHPLFNADNEPEEDRITGQEVVKEMEKLKLLFPQWTKSLHNYFTLVYPVKRSICRLCNFTPFSPKLFYVHLFDGFHIAQLAKCQISKKSFEFWELNFSDMKELEDEGTEKKETRKFDIRKESAKFGTFSEILNMVDRKWGIPLLDPSIKPVAKLQQDQFIRYYKSLSTAMTNPAARQIAKLKKVNWKCGYCSSNVTTVAFNTELEAFDHILGQKHEEKMKFTAPLDDLLYWGNWAVEINNELAAKEEEDQKKVPEDPTSSGNSQNQMTTSSASTSTPVPALGFRNNPRVALMDPPITTDRFQMCRQDKFVHFCNELSASLTEIGIKTANSRHANWKCGYCSSETDTVVCNTQFDAFNHVLKQKHKEKMKFTAPELDFKFWCDWVDEMNSGASQSTSTVVQNLPELQKSESQVSQKSAAKVPENSNNSRVPLLAPMPKNENTVSKKQFNEMLDECAKMFQTHKKRLSAAKNIPAFVACSYCSKPDAKPLAPCNIQDQLLHILKVKHRENMQYKACLSDLQYWKSWVENYGISGKVLESRKSPSTVPPNPKPSSEILNTEPFKKGSNNPRVPLLDVPVHKGNLLRQSQYREYCEHFCKVLREKQPCAETEKSIECICFHCPGDTRITTNMELIQHVFNGKHGENIRFLASRDDFTYIEDIIRKMPATVFLNTIPQEAEAAAKPANDESMMDQIPTPIPTDPVHRTISEIPPQRRRPCNLPLYVRPKMNCSGPRKSQVAFINGLASKRINHPIPYVADGTFCDCCDEDMSGWDEVRCALHGFSVSHLRKLGNLPHFTDFQHWIEIIVRRRLSPSPQVSSCRLEIFLDLKSMKALSDVDGNLGKFEDLAGI